MLAGLLMPVSIPEQSSLSHRPVFVGALELIERPVGFRHKGGLYGVLFSLVIGAAALTRSWTSALPSRASCGEAQNIRRGTARSGSS